MNKIILSASILAALGLTACVKDPVDNLGSGAPLPPEDDPTTAIPEKPGAFASGPSNTFNHMGDLSEGGGKDPFEILAQRQEEGPAEIRTRLHSCQKLQNTALRNMLQSFGVDLGAKGNPPSAGQLLSEGGGALGAAVYDARQGEAIVWSAAGAAKLFDIFVQAAPEIIANLSKSPQCQVDGVGPEPFDASGHCNKDALSCLMGRTATKEHVAICESLVGSATNMETGKRLAIATVLSAAHSCE
jgi:hypothetical protein